MHAVNPGAAVPELGGFSTFIQTHKSMHFMPCLKHVDDALACMHARQHAREHMYMHALNLVTIRGRHSAIADT